MVSRSVAIPALRAETLSPPMAKIQLPTRDRCRTKNSTTTNIAHQKIVTWNMPPTNWPSSSFVGTLGTMNTPVLPAIITVSPSVRPMTPNIVPMVMMSEGTARRVTRSPLTYPTISPTARPARMPTTSGAWKCPETIAVVSEAAGITAPTEMSSSPAIIKSPTGSATMPISAAMLSQLAAPAGLRNVAPPKMAKKTKTAARPRNDPASGRRASRPSAAPTEGAADAAAGVAWIAMSVAPALRPAVAMGGADREGTSPAHAGTGRLFASWRVCRSE